jgi:5-methylcytosine-specific restriction endonuclease McrA
MGARWGNRGVPQHIRIRVFQRDGWRCQLGLDGCTYHAEEIDHIVSVASLGINRDEANDERLLQSVCRSCHHIRTEAQRLAGWRASQQRRYERRHLSVPKKHPGEW